MMGLGQPPAALSKPFRLKMIFTLTLVRFTVSRGLGHGLGMPANSPSFAVHTTESGQFASAVASSSPSATA
jgi:hypothetical protein